jgi:hypothetical protein
MFSLVELFMRGIMQKKRKKTTRSIFKIATKLFSRSELPCFTVPVRVFYGQWWAHLF